MTTDPGQQPTGVLPPGFQPADAVALQELADAGVGEGDFGEDHGVPPDLVELHEVLEWEHAVDTRDQGR